jgi:VWFA-related protein
VIGARPVSLLAAMAAVVAGAIVVDAVQDRTQVRSSVEVIIVTATVRDADGRLAADLPREAFEIYEDGVRAPVTQFTTERVPLGLGLLLDISDSMFGRRIKDAESAVERFLLELLAPTDAFFVMAFNHEPHLLFGWKNAPDGVHESLARLHPSGSTAIYDAIDASLPFIQNRPRERAAIVLITDGEDTASDMTLYDLRPALVRTDAFVYAIALDAPDSRASTRVNADALREITGPSGGYTEVVRDTAELGPATARIADELAAEYPDRVMVVHRRGQRGRGVAGVEHRHPRVVERRVFRI